LPDEKHFDSRSRQIIFRRRTDDGFGQIPSVQTFSASNITQNSAVLNGQVNPNGLQTQYYFEYGTTPSMGNTTGFLSAGSGTNFIQVSQSVFGLLPNTTYYFRLNASNSQGLAQGNIFNFRTTGDGGGQFPLVQTLSATNIAQNSATLNGQVNPNGADTQVYFEYGTNPNALTLTTGFTTAGSGFGYINFSQTASNLSAGTTYYFRAVAINSFGTARGQILSFTTSGTVNTGAPIVLTSPATVLGPNSAILNGRVSAAGLATVWFEYGSTLALGLTTVPQSVNANNLSLTNFSSAAAGLLPNTVYYFRAVAQNQSGIDRGAILSFRTTRAGGGGGSVIIVPTSTTGISLTCFNLVPTLTSEKLAPGEDFTISVAYKNNCGFDFTDASLKVILPAETEFKSSSFPLFTLNGNVITYNLGTLRRGTEASVIIDGTVDEDVEIGDNLLFTTTFSGTDNRGQLQSVSAYLTAVVGAGTGLLAAILAILGDLLGNWLFWLLLILIIILLFYLASRRRADSEPDVKNIRVVT